MSNVINARIKMIEAVENAKARVEGDENKVKAQQTLHTGSPKNRAILRIIARPQNQSIDNHQQKRKPEMEGEVIIPPTEKRSKLENNRVKEEILTKAAGEEQSAMEAEKQQADMDVVANSPEADISKQKLTNQSKWSAIGGAALFFDETIGQMRSFDSCQIARKKLLKNKREIDTEEIFRKASSYQKTDPGKAEIWKTLGFLGEHINIEFGRNKQEKRTEKSGENAYGIFNFQSVDKTLSYRTKSDYNFLLIDCLQNSAIISLVGKSLDQVTQIVTLEIMKHACANDRFFLTYCFPLSNRSPKYVVAGQTLPTTIAEFVLSGYKANSDNERSLRVESYCREIIENFLCRERKRFENVNGAGSTEILANFLLGNIRFEEDGNIGVYKESLHAIVLKFTHAQLLQLIDPSVVGSAPENVETQRSVDSEGREDDENEQAVDD